MIFLKGNDDLPRTEYSLRALHVIVGTDEDSLHRVRVAAFVSFSVYSGGNCNATNWQEGFIPSFDVC